MGSPILGYLDLRIIGENRHSRKWVNKTEVTTFVLTKQSKGKITLNRELSTKLIQKNSLLLTGHKSQFSDK
jgi:hypothetical protein